MKFKEDLTLGFVIQNTILPISSIITGIWLYYIGEPAPSLIVTLTGISGLIFIIKEVFIKDEN